MAKPEQYEQMELRHQLGRLPEFHGIPPDVDDGLLAIRLGKLLGVPAHLVDDLDPEWRRNAIVQLHVDALLAERAHAKDAR